MSSSARVWWAARTAVLLLGAAVASVSMVQLPAPATGGQTKAPTHVPASDKWLALGAPGTPDPRDGKAVNAVNPTATIDGREPRTRCRARPARHYGTCDHGSRAAARSAGVTRVDRR
jgi:hypothetical protein